MKTETDQLAELINKYEAEATASNWWGCCDTASIFSRFLTELHKIVARPALADGEAGTKP